MKKEMGLVENPAYFGFIRMKVWYVINEITISFVLYIFYNYCFAFELNKLYFLFFL
jgi:hypothetical protein